MNTYRNHQPPALSLEDELHGRLMKGIFTLGFMIGRYGEGSADTSTNPPSTALTDAQIAELKTAIDRHRAGH